MAAAETLWHAQPSQGLLDCREMSLKDQASEGLGMGLSERLGLLGRTARGFFEAGLPGPEKKGYQVSLLHFVALCLWLEACLIASHN